VTRTSDPEGASESDVTVSDRSICFVFCWPHSTIKKKKRKTKWSRSCKIKVNH